MRTLRIFDLLPGLTFCWFLLFSVPVPGWVQAQNPLDTMFDRVSRSLVKVECLDTGNSASGFVWSGRETVVTALHVVDRSSDIQLYFPGAKVRRRAVVDKVLKEADLTLLRVENAPDLPVLLPAGQRPETNEGVHALGYPLNIQTHSSTSLKLRYGGRRLEEIIPPKVIQGLKRNGYPNPGLEIVNLEGNLVPGLSGAPIVNDQGQVVAIADGGLESGAIGISWGIPVRLLKDLAASGSRALPGSSAVQELFAADLNVQLESVISYKGMHLTKVKSRTLEQLAETTDDPQALFQFMQVLNLAQLVVGPFDPEFDIYQHLPSGATFAVPAGFELRSGEGMILATTKDLKQRLEMRIAISKGSSLPDIQLQSQIIEQDLLKAGTMQWQADPAWTYLAPKTRFDGLVVNRKGFYGMAYSGYSLVPAQYAFETLAARNTVLLINAAVDKGYTQQTLQMEAACGLNPSLDVCQGILEARRIYIQMALAAFFTSFSL